MSRNLRLLCAMAWCGLGCMGVWAQGSIDWLRVERASEDSVTARAGTVALYADWVKDSHHLTLRHKEGKVTTHYLVDAERFHKRRLVADVKGFVRQYEQLTHQKADTSDLPLYGISFPKEHPGCFQFNSKGKSLLYDMASGVLQEDTTTRRTGGPIHIADSHTTPDSLFTMMGCGYDLYVRDNCSGLVTRITADGTAECSYASGVHTDTVCGAARGFWLGHRYICMLQDQGEVATMSLLHALGSGRPRTETFRMPMPGDKGVRRYRMFWYDADHATGRLLPIDKYPDQVVSMGHYRSDQSLYFTRRSRKADKIDLCRIDVCEGRVEELISETVKPHINLTLTGYRVLDHGERILWWSERTGRGHYYLYDGHGKLLNRVTQGSTLVAGEVVAIDTLHQRMVFAGYDEQLGSDPCYRYYYTVQLNGKRQRLLTPGDGHHTLSLSHDLRYAADSYSRADLPPVVSVVDVWHPERSKVVAACSDSLLLKAGWVRPQLVRVKAADGQTDLCGVMYCPSSMQPGRKYPIITNVYPGPQDDQLQRFFAIDDNGNQSLAEMGFVVVSVPPRGSSPWRGRDFYCYGYGNLRDYPLADNRAVVEQLAARYGFIDLDRVGIYGHSGGGFMTVAAMLTDNDFYKVGVAASGNHDNNIYIQWWGEVFHGVEEVTDSLTGEVRFESHIPTNAALAQRLKGRLLLITGDVDKNVPPANTYRLVDAFVKAGKKVDLFVLPGMDHALYGSYYQNMIRYYFAEHLLGMPVRHTDIIHHQ